MAAGTDGFTAFVVGRYPRMLRAAVLLGVPRADAEDAVQDALARCYASWSRVRAAKDPEAYAYRILVNGVRRSARRRWRGEIPHAELPEPAGDSGSGAPDPAAGLLVVGMVGVAAQVRAVRGADAPAGRVTRPAPASPGCVAPAVPRLPPDWARAG